jgi:hypothetical protein
LGAAIGERARDDPESAIAVDPNAERLEPGTRIDVALAVGGGEGARADLEMEMRRDAECAGMTVAPVGLAHIPDDVARLDDLARFDAETAEMRVQRPEAARVSEHDRMPVAAESPRAIRGGVRDEAGEHGAHGLADARGEIEPVVESTTARTLAHPVGRRQARAPRVERWNRADACSARGCGIGPILGLFFLAS